MGQFFDPLKYWCRQLECSRNHDLYCVHCHQNYQRRINSTNSITNQIIDHKYLSKYSELWAHNRYLWRVRIDYLMQLLFPNKRRKYYVLQGIKIQQEGFDLNRWRTLYFFFIFNSSENFILFSLVNNTLNWKKP